MGLWANIVRRVLIYLYIIKGTERDLGLLSLLHNSFSGNATSFLVFFCPTPFLEIDSPTPQQLLC